MNEMDKARPAFGGLYTGAHRIGDAYPHVQNLQETAKLDDLKDLLIRTSPNPKVCLPHAGSEVDKNQHVRNEYLFFLSFLPVPIRGNFCGTAVYNSRVYLKRFSVLHVFKSKLQGVARKMLRCLNAALNFLTTFNFKARKVSSALCGKVIRDQFIVECLHRFFPRCIAKRSRVLLVNVNLGHHEVCICAVLHLENDCRNIPYIWHCYSLYKHLRVIAGELLQHRKNSVYNADRTGQHADIHRANSSKLFGCVVRYGGDDALPYQIIYAKQSISGNLFTAYSLTSLAFGRGLLTLLRRRFGFVLSVLFLPTFSSVPGRLRQGVTI